jgi:hypothetical protein
MLHTTLIDASLLVVSTASPEHSPHSGRLNDLDGHDFGRVVVPLGELGFVKRGFFDVLGVGVIVDLELDGGASRDLHCSPDSFHDASQRKTFPSREGSQTMFMKKISGCD